MPLVPGAIQQARTNQLRTVIEEYAQRIGMPEIYTDNFHDDPVLADPTAYELPKYYVKGSIAGRQVKLELVLQKDVTAYELNLIKWILVGRVTGNLMVCIVEEGLMRHFKEVDADEIEPLKLPTTEELAARVTATQQQLAWSQQYNNALNQAMIVPQSFLDEKEKLEIRQAEPRSMTLQTLKEAFDLVWKPKA
jgi:hypothetical protein